MAWSLKDAFGAVQQFVSDVSGSTHTAVHAVAPRTAGGLSIYRNLDVQATGQVVKASAGQLYRGMAFNAAAAVRYLKVYDKATAPSSSDVPKITIPIPAGTALPLDFTGLGAAFTNGIGVRATNALADNDNTAPTANDVILNLFYF